MTPAETPLTWPPGPGEMAARIRDHDWAGTPLGPVADWPEALRTVVAMILALPQPAYVCWGPEGVLSYNDSFAPILGERHPHALGRPFREVWPEVWDEFRPVFATVMAGEAQFFEDRLVALLARPDRPVSWFTFSWTPLRAGAGAGAVEGLLCLAVETTDRILAERSREEDEERRNLLATLRSSEERQAFLLGLSDALRPLGDPLQIQKEASRILGQHLRADRVAYAEDSGDGETVVLTCNYTNGVPGIEGRYRYVDYGDDLIREMRAGRSVVRPDIANDPLLSEAEKAAHAVLQLRATLNVPLVKDGNLLAILAVHYGAAHAFTPEEVSLVQEVGERTWAAVERTRAEARLREGEERYRAIVETATDYAIFTTDTEGRIETWPAGAQKVFGWTAEEAVGQPMDMTFTPEDQDRAQPERERREARETGQGLNIRWHLRKDGTRIFIDGVTRPLTGANGALAGYVKVGQDVTERRQAEERLQLATGAARIGIFDVDLITGAITWDARLRDLWGVGAEEVVTDDTFIGGVHPDDRGLVRGAVGRAFGPEGDHLYIAEYRIRHRVTGGESWIAATGRAHFDQGRPVRLVGTVQDISDRKRAEIALRELNETLESRVAEALAGRKLLADVFENTAAMLSVADPDLRLLALNRPYADEVERLGGRRPQVGDRIPDLYVGQPDLAVPVEANWRRAVTGEVFTVTEEHGDPGRYRRCYERRFEPLYDRDGGILGAYQYATDVTDRRRDQRRAAEAEAARREADALYRAYFQNSAEGLFVIGVQPDGRFTIEESNPADRALLAGLGLELRVGQPLDEQLPPEAVELVTAHYRRVIETGEVRRYRASAPSGTRTVHFETVLVPVRDETGRISRIMGSTRDMTAQVQAEEALRQSQKMEAMGQLTGGVAHDFNNLLTPILGGLDRLQRRALGDERDQRLIEGALQSAERARTLVQRLLAFARRQPLQPAPIDVADLVRGMADLVTSTTGPQIRVEVEVDPGLPPALADANQLEMAILNLAVNARDAMPGGGTLTIAATREEVPPGRPDIEAPPGRYVRLSVTDTGTGMDEITLARAVEPFFSTKGIGRGTGLGLSMAHGLAAQLGGALSIRSRPGQGTSIGLWLPVARDGVEAASTGPRPELPATAVGRVLLVDDEDLVRATTADMLGEMGFEVVQAGSAEEALQLIDGGLAPDLILTDHLMPGMTGAELARSVPVRLPGVPVLVVSGYAEAAGLAPNLPRLTKPYRAADLAASIAALRAGPGKGRA